jgi:PDZ domain-containing protein
MVTPTEPEAHGRDVPSAPAGPDGGVPGGDVTSRDAGDAVPGAAVPSDAPAPARRPRRWQVVSGIVGLLVVAFVVSAAVVPLPYYLFKPGSVRDTEPLITVSGTEVYPSDGSIAYTTVSLRQATLLGLAQGWLDDDIDVFDRDEVLGGRDVDENREVNLQMMSDSKQVATQVALERLGYPVEVTVGQLVVEVVPDSPSDGRLEAGDVITAVDDETFDDAGDLTDLLADDPPGSEITATVESPPTVGHADGETRSRDVEIALAPSPDDPERGVMGVRVQPIVVEYEFPFEVEIDTGDVGGPSAGLAFTLALIDDLTPGDLTGGSAVAVTGTISGDGTVGPVGGTGQKAAAVRSAGFDLFLVPTADYDDAVAHAGGDLSVVSVDSIDEALAALGEHGGNIDDLPEAGEVAAAPFAR